VSAREYKPYGDAIVHTAFVALGKFSGVARDRVVVRNGDQLHPQYTKQRPEAYHTDPPNGIYGQQFPYLIAWKICHLSNLCRGDRNAPLLGASSKGIDKRTVAAAVVYNGNLAASSHRAPYATNGGKVGSGAQRRGTTIERTLLKGRGTVQPPSCHSGPPRRAVLRACRRNLGGLRLRRLAGMSGHDQETRTGKAARQVRGAGLHATWTRHDIATQAISKGYGTMSGCPILPSYRVGRRGLGGLFGAAFAH
jgi:hypothetical protein